MVKKSSSESPSKVITPEELFLNKSAMDASTATNISTIRGSSISN